MNDIWMIATPEASKPAIGTSGPGASCWTSPRGDKGAPAGGAAAGPVLAVRRGPALGDHSGRANVG